MALVRQVGSRPASLPALTNPNDSRPYDDMTLTVYLKGGAQHGLPPAFGNCHIAVLGPAPNEEHGADTRAPLRHGLAAVVPKLGSALAHDREAMSSVAYMRGLLAVALADSRAVESALAQSSRVADRTGALAQPLGADSGCVCFPPDVCHPMVCPTCGCNEAVCRCGLVSDSGSVSDYEEEGISVYGGLASYSSDNDGNNDGHNDGGGGDDDDDNGDAYSAFSDDDNNSDDSGEGDRHERDMLSACYLQAAEAVFEQHALVGTDAGSTTPDGGAGVLVSPPALSADGSLDSGVLVEAAVSDGNDDDGATEDDGRDSALDAAVEALAPSQPAAAVQPTISRDDVKHVDDSHGRRVHVMQAMLASQPPGVTVEGLRAALVALADNLGWDISAKRIRDED